MIEYQHILYEEKKQIATLWLNRPEIRNAFNEDMIVEIINALDQVKKNKELRALVIRGKGQSFCSGADLNWMRDVKDYSYEENLREGRRLSACFQAIYSCSIPTVALVHGAAIGGANGLLASCDFVLAEKETVFSLSEVKIGVIPACISPFVVKRMGEFNSRYLMLSGKRINGEEAKGYGLINEIGSMEEIEKALGDFLSMIKTSGPVAVGECKKLLYGVCNQWTYDEALEHTARLIAEIRQSDEAQEGMAAFLEKRKPNWVKD